MSGVRVNVGQEGLAFVGGVARSCFFSWPCILITYFGTVLLYSNGNGSSSGSASSSSSSCSLMISLLVLGGALSGHSPSYGIVRCNRKMQPW